ncbi:AaceriAER407Cp [[Ashbya] aceris (nom. inval.)]|nr:AaceriAER407Cp [[Ashbya] aceris (nom. inval.)]
MMDKILVAIAGSYGAGVYETGLKIKEELGRRFPHEITVIDLDSMVKTDCKTYTDEDYDFEKVQHVLQRSRAELEIIILCGCYALCNKRLNALSNLKVFLDTEGDRRLINLIHKNNVTTSEELRSTISHYMDCLRPEYHSYIAPSRSLADIIIPATHETTGTAIIIDGIVEIVDELQGRMPYGRKLSPHLDFQVEDMNVEKDRYYDLS